MKESQNTEWKQSWRDEYLKWVCGFANAEGGVLVIGRDDAGNDVGIDNAERLLEDIPNKIRSLLGIVVDVGLLESDGKDLLQLTVEAHAYPISYKGQYHVRSGSTKQELKGAALDNFLLKKQGRHWDGVPVPHVSVEDLSSDALERFKSYASSAGRIGERDLELTGVALIEKLHLTEGQHLKRAAVLLFHPEPTKYVTGATVKIGYFESDSDLVFQDEIEGDLFQVVEKTMDLLTTKYLRAEISYRGLQREESLPVPESALREAVMNAVAHKDYASNTPIQISVYRDRLMIWNNGRLQDGWTIKTLTEKHSTQPFNPDMANTLYRAGLIESWGRGIEKMISSCEEHKGCGVPHFRYEESGVWVDFVWNAPNAKLIYSSDGYELLGLDKPLSLNQQRVLMMMKENPAVTIAEIASGLALTEKTIQRYVHFFKEKGIGSRLGTKLSGAWVLNIIVDKATNVPKNVPNGVPNGVPKEIWDKLPEIQQKILSSMSSDGSVLVSQIALFVGVTSKTVKRHISCLRELALLEREGGKHGGKWIVSPNVPTNVPNVPKNVPKNVGNDVGINVGNENEENEGE